MSARSPPPVTAACIQDLYLAGRLRDAAAQVPVELIAATAPVGPVERVVRRADRYARAGVGTLAMSPVAETVTEKLSVIRSLSVLVRDDERSGA